MTVESGGTPSGDQESGTPTLQSVGENTTLKFIRKALDEGGEVEIVSSEPQTETSPGDSQVEDDLPGRDAVESISHGLAIATMLDTQKHDGGEPHLASSVKAEEHSLLNRTMRAVRRIFTK